MTNKQNVPEATYMLYKYPGDKFLHGDYFSTKIVKESELPEALDEEWFLTSKEAKESNPPKEDATEAEIDQNDDENKSNEAVSEATESELPEAADEEWFLTSKEAKESNPPKEDATEAEIDQNDDENKSNEAVSEATESELPEAADEESVPDKGHTKKRGGRKRNADK